MRTLVDSFHKIVRHHCWIQRLGVLLALLLIMLAFLAMVQQWRGLKMWSHHVQQPEHIHYHGSIPSAHNQYIRIFRIYRIHSSRLFNCTCSYVQITIECLFCYCCHNCKRPQSTLCSKGFTQPDNQYDSKVITFWCEVDSMWHKIRYMVREALSGAEINYYFC